MIIDARDILTTEMFASFAKDMTDESDVLIAIKGDKSWLTKKKTFLTEILALEIDDTVQLECSYDDNKLLITGYDVNWWKKNARRYNKLYRAIEEVKTVIVKTYKVAVATLSEGQLSQIKAFEGDKKSVIAFFNSEITSRYLDDFLKMNVVLNLAYVDGDENDVSQWLTVDELQEIGAIKLHD